MPRKKEEIVKIPRELPILPVRDIVVFPYMILPLFVARTISINAIDEALAKNRLIFLAAQKDQGDEEPRPDQLHQVGTVALIMRMLKMPDGRIKILVQGVSRARIEEVLQEEPFMRASIKQIREKPEGKKNLEAEALVRTVKEQMQKVADLGKVVLPDIMVVAENLDEPGRLADLLGSNLGLKMEEAQEVLEITDPLTRLQKVNELLSKEMDLLEMQEKIHSRTKGEIDKSQREYYLREQLKSIQTELGEIDERSAEIAEYEAKIKEAAMPEKVRDQAVKQLERMGHMHPEAAEASLVRTYLDWLVEIPWSRSTTDNLDISLAERVLDEDHYDLEKVKDRILEFLAVRKLKEKMKGPVLCFVGPPGVGKTSLGRSIARALGRKFVRISLGGVRDEAEIRGHRRTYVGALPGKIIQGIHGVGSNNPVFMMDEVDKIGADFRGDPSSALLEVLDPEQNNSFADHYLGVPFDLSNVMFITTANLLDPIPPALKDRMEVLNLPGYTDDEKLHIARRYLLERQLEDHGLHHDDLTVSDTALLGIIHRYTREAGLRNLEREIAAICRKVARNIASGRAGPFHVTARNIKKYLGPRKFFMEGELEKNDVGVATGLAWTQAGGEILYVETTLMKGKGSVILTGQLGDVMKESAQAAISYTRTKARELGVDPEFSIARDIHIHVPAGAIPKDGPSAGITIATALVSSLTGIPVNKDVAMTGEITLRGKVLPIGGLKEKVLAAHRAGIKTVILPARNSSDLEEIPPKIKRTMKFVPVDSVGEVLEQALISSPLKGTGVSRRRREGGASRNHDVQTPTRSEARGGGDRL
jgi:ATP-dependent Lon protease